MGGLRYREDPSAQRHRLSTWSFCAADVTDTTRVCCRVYEICDLGGFHIREGVVGGFGGIRRGGAVLTTIAMLLAVIAVKPNPAAAAGPGRREVPGSAPAWATPGRDIGSESGSRQVTVAVYLALHDAAGAADYVRQVSDPSSANYGHYLTPDQYAARFEVGPADVAAVRSFLATSGLTVTSADSTSVVATAALSTAQAAFGTTVHRYRYRGRVLDAPTSNLSVPSTVADKVVAVAGLDQSGILNHPLDDIAGRSQAAAAATAAPGVAGVAAPPPPAFVNAPPCSTYFGQIPATQYPKVNGMTVPFAPCGYTPAQFQGAYGTDRLINSGIDGRGVTVAITDAYAAPTILADANQYRAAPRSGPPERQPVPPDPAAQLQIWLRRRRQWRPLR